MQGLRGSAPPLEKQTIWKWDMEEVDKKAVEGGKSNHG
jgi:hypothetical protein